MFSPPTRCFQKQESRAPKLLHLSSLQQDVRRLFDKPSDGKRLLIKHVGVHFIATIALCMLFCNFCIQSSEGLPSVTNVEENRQPRINLKGFRVGYASPRALFRSPIGTQTIQKVEGSQTFSSITHPPCHCDGKWMQACTEECMRKNMTSVVSAEGGTSFSISSGGRTTDTVVAEGPTSQFSSAGLISEELERSTDVADAADQDLEELINSLNCDCSGQVMPSCTAACASRKETVRITSNITTSCFCDGKLLDPCPQRCIPVNITKVENIVSNGTTIIGGFSSSGGHFSSSITIPGRTSISSDTIIGGGLNSADFFSNSSITSSSLGSKIMGDVNITTGKLESTSNGKLESNSGKPKLVLQFPPSGAPCICEGKYQRVCTVECLRIPTTKQLPIDQLPGTVVDSASPLPPIAGEADNHPDHASNDAFPVVELDPISNKTALQRPPPLSSKVALPPYKVGETILEGNGEIIRHRKVYVTDRPRVKAVIRPFRITIPIQIEEPKTTYIDPPPPVFKMRTYTEYETKPETVQMPVVTTIIKPKKIRKEQIVY